MVLAIPATDKGSFYPGTLAELKRPTYPYRFERNVNSSDRFSLGGTAFSVIRNVRRFGMMNFVNVPEVDLPTWENFFVGSNSFRDVFVCEDPTNLNLVNCTSTNDFPLQLDLLNLYGGTMELIEYV